LPFDPPATPDAPRKFRHRYWVHVLWFLATLVSTTLFCGLFFGLVVFDYSLPVLAILAAHEFGHYFACRRYDVDATLPYFIPAPIILTGTFGAVIRIRQGFPSKAALFDIAVAGPIAGFLALLPFLFYSFRFQTIAAIDPARPPDVIFGEPLLFKLASLWWFGPLPAGADEIISPMGFAAWVGMLATALNLLPFGQLDGGHVSYAVFGKRSWIVSALTLATTIAMTFISISWLATALIMVIMAMFLGLGHPQVPDSEAPLDPARKAIAVLVVIIFALCVTPVPIVLFGG
jgi:membrane-associated protease RseP (regulator of RpoE activity)